jgi:hypothetical protein
VTIEPLLDSVLDMETDAAAIESVGDDDAVPVINGNGASPKREKKERKHKDKDRPKKEHKEKKHKHKKYDVDEPQEGSPTVGGDFDGDEQQHHSAPPEPSIPASDLGADEEAEEGELPPLPSGEGHARTRPDEQQKR